MSNKSSQSPDFSDLDFFMGKRLYAYGPGLQSSEPGLLNSGVKEGTCFGRRSKVSHLDLVKFEKLSFEITLLMLMISMPGRLHETKYHKFVD